MRRARFLYFLCFLNLLHFLAACHKSPQSKITIGSKFFTEQVILAGAIPAALLALLADFFLGLLERRLKVS